MSADEVPTQVIEETTTPKERRKAEKEARKRAELDAKMAKYRRLRANVRRRRVAYGLFIVLAILVFVATAWDIIYNDSDLKWPLLAGYVVLFILGILLLFSRSRHLQELNQIKALERTWLQCDTCSSVFQFGSESFQSRRRVGFTCPVCGDESALPLPGAETVERDIPQGQLEENNYLCGNCKEDIAVGTYGRKPREIDFRACPRCGEKGVIRPNLSPA